jgi:hypothetical protein
MGVYTTVAVHVVCAPHDTCAGGLACYKEVYAATMHRCSLEVAAVHSG